MKIDTDKVAAIRDPLKRIAAAEEGISESSNALGVFAKIRAKAVRQLLLEHTGDEVAEMLGVERTSIYRTIRKHVPLQTDIQFEKFERLERQKAPPPG